MYILLFILFILLILIIAYIISGLKPYKFNRYGSSESAVREGKMTGATRDRRDAKRIVEPTMQDRSRGNSIEFHRHGKFNEVEFVRAGMTGKFGTNLSYTISGEGNGLDYSQLRKLLSQKEYFIERPITENVTVSFGSYGGFKNEHRKLNFDPDFFKQHAAIKNVLDRHNSIVKKLLLFKTIKYLIPLGNQFIPKTYTTEEFDALSDAAIKYPLIVKKDNTCKQTGIKIVTSKEEYYAAKKELKLHNDAVISEYITKPLTIGGIKMHLRVYLLVSVKSGIIKSFIFDEYKIYLAEAPYKEGDWLNPKIHISGVNQNTKIYKWPDDLDRVNGEQINIDVINYSLEECKRVLAMAVVSTNTDKYSESDGGYHLYGIDILPTQTGQVYILEVNHHPGFGWVTANKEVTQSFSYTFFSFILNNTVFPMLGLTRPEPPYAENTMASGSLIPFAKVLIGENRCILIPHLTATKDEIASAHKINFFKKIYSFEHFMESGAELYLIGSGTIIIGYIALDQDGYISIAVMEDYQNRGIATAMIAQLLDIYMARHYTEKIPYIVKIKKENTFMNLIATRLHFVLNSNNEYERPLKMPHIGTNTHITHSGHKLT